MARPKKEKDENNDKAPSIQELRDRINKKAGMTVAYDLTKENPTDVKEWISTGSRWLDSIICKGQMGGVPKSKIIELSGLSGSGKSYMAIQIAGNDMKKGYTVVYFDSESAIDSGFIQRMGIDLDDFIYVQATSVEYVLETIEELMGQSPKPYIFIWDSLAMTPSINDIEGDFNPNSSIGVKARILSKGFSKLVIPLANHGSILLVLNQLKTNITNSVAEKYIDPYVTPGGKSLIFAASWRIYLTMRRGKASYILDENEQQIGSEVKATIKKSRFGREGRTCSFKILWAGDKLGIMDQESWMEAIKSTSYVKNSGAWFTMDMGDGTEEKFQSNTFLDKLKEKRFHDRVLAIMDEVLIEKGTDRPERDDDMLEPPENTVFSVLDKEGE